MSKLFAPSQGLWPHYLCFFKGLCLHQSDLLGTHLELFPGVKFISIPFSWSSFRIIQHKKEHKILDRLSRLHRGDSVVSLKSELLNQGSRWRWTDPRGPVSEVTLRWTCLLPQPSGDLPMTRLAGVREHLASTAAIGVQVASLPPLPVPRVGRGTLPQIRDAASEPFLTQCSELPCPVYQRWSSGGSTLPILDLLQPPPFTDEETERS